MSDMDRRPVVFLDSGIGGIPYCSNFHLCNPGENLIYLADRVNFPYGEKTGDEIARILLNLVDRIIKKADPKLVVLACNTATVCGLKILRGHFASLPIVGTVPAIKPAAQASKTKIIGVLGTGRTINDPYIAELANKFGPCAIQGIAAPKLVDFIEKEFDTAAADEKISAVRGYIERLRALRADVLVLGCTHFLFLADEFRREAAPDIQVFDSIEGITRRIETLLDEDGGRLRAGSGGPVEKLLLLTGAAPPDSAWKRRAENMGFTLSVPGDL